MNAPTLIFEVSGVLLFLAVVFSCLRQKDYRAIAQILAGSVFGVVLEYMNVLLFDAYTYSPYFVIQIFSAPFNIPVCVGLFWGLIIYACTRVSDRVGLPQWSRPFLDALLALSIDLSIDAIAIRLDGGFWSWTGIPMETACTTNSFFGVHYGNFVGWFFVVLIFSTLVRFESRVLCKRYRISVATTALYFVALPFISYYLLYKAIVLCPLPIYFVNQMLFSADVSNIQLVCMIVLGYLCLASVLIQVIAYFRSRNKRTNEKGVDWVSLTLFAYFHFMFLYFYLSEGYYSEAPALFYVGILMLVLDGVVHGVIIDWKKVDIRGYIGLRRLSTQVESNRS